MITDVRLLDFVKDYEMEDFRREVQSTGRGQTDCKSRQKVTEPVDLKSLKQSVPKEKDTTPIDIDELQTSKVTDIPNSNSMKNAKDLFDEILNDLKHETELVNERFKLGIISKEAYDLKMKQISELRQKTVKTYVSGKGGM